MKTRYIALLVGALYACANAFGTPIFYDNFTGTSLDTEKWASGGWGTQSVTVADDTVTLQNAGWNHHASIYTLEDFNFHEASLGFQVDLVSMTPSAWTGTNVNRAAELWFAWGPAKMRTMRGAAVPLRQASVLRSATRREAVRFCGTRQVCSEVWRFPISRRK